MKTELILWTGVALMAAVVISSLAMAGEEEKAILQEQDWSERSPPESPLAFGEPMADCDRHHPALVAKDEVVPAIMPAVIEVEPVKAPVPPKKQLGQLSPGQLSPGALFAFALIASPGGQLPVNAKQ